MTCFAVLCFAFVCIEVEHYFRCCLRHHADGYMTIPRKIIPPPPRIVRSPPCAEYIVPAVVFQERLFFIVGVAGGGGGDVMRQLPFLTNRVRTAIFR